MISRRIFFLFLFLSPLFGTAQDVDTQYLRLQEAYSQRLQEIEQRYQQQQRELLNKFILALVRTEQTFREEGNLDGVMVSRELRDELLQQSALPPVDVTWPARILSMVEELEKRKREYYLSSQQELDALNQVLLRTLEPYKVEFTKQGNLRSAIEVRNVQDRLAEALGIDLKKTEPIVPDPSVEANNPNAYTFLLEPAAFQDRTGISPRQAIIPLTPETQGEVNTLPKGFAFDGGILRLPPEQLDPLLERTRRNQTLTVEFGISTPWSSQGNQASPACLFLWGDSLEDANLAVTQEGPNLYLLLNTSNPPVTRSTHRVDLGKLSPNDTVHIMVMYRTNELTVYRDGAVSLRLRSSIQGSFVKWESAGMVIGRAPLGNGEAESTTWYGQLHQLCIKAGQDASRRATDFYQRFQQAMAE